MPPGHEPSVLATGNPRRVQNPSNLSKPLSFAPEKPRGSETLALLSSTSSPVLRSAACQRRLSKATDKTKALAQESPRTPRVGAQRAPPSRQKAWREKPFCGRQREEAAERSWGCRQKLLGLLEAPKRVGGTKAFAQREAQRGGLGWVDWELRKSGVRSALPSQGSQGRRRAAQVKDERWKRKEALTVALKSARRTACSQLLRRAASDSSKGGTDASPTPPPQRPPPEPPRAAS